MTEFESAVVRYSVDTEDLMQRIDGDRVFLAELTALFLADYPVKIRAIQEAILCNDAPEIKRASHALRGTLYNLSASKAGQLAANLERTASSGDMKTAKTNLQNLENELVNTINSLDDLCRETVP